MAIKPNEVLAEYAHRSWVNWMNDLMHEPSVWVCIDGSVTISREAVLQMHDHMSKPYDGLSSSEKARWRRESVSIVRLFMGEEDTDETGHR